MRGLGAHVSAAIAICFGLAIDSPGALAAPFDADAFCRDRKGSFPMLVDMHLPVGGLRLDISKHIACPDPASRVATYIEFFLKLRIGNPTVPSGTTVETSLFSTGRERLIILLPEATVFMLDGPKRSRILSHIQASTDGASRTLIGEGNGEAAVLPIWGSEQKKRPLSPLLDDDTIAIISDRWLEIGTGHVVDLRERRAYMFALDVKRLYRVRVVGVAPDDRTLIWIGAYERGGFALVLSDMRAGSSVEHRIDDLLPTLGIRQYQPDFTAIDPAWIARHFRLASAQTEPMRLERRRAVRFRAVPPLVGPKNEGAPLSLGCVNTDRLVPILLKALKREWGVDPGPASDRRFGQPGAYTDTFDCGAKSSVTDRTRRRYWSFEIEGYRFDLGISDRKSLTFSFVGGVGEKQREFDPWGAALGYAIAASLSQRLAEPDLARHLYRP